MAVHREGDRVKVTATVHSSSGSGCPGDRGRVAGDRSTEPAGGVLHDCDPLGHPLGVSVAPGRDPGGAELGVPGSGLVQGGLAPGGVDGGDPAEVGVHGPPAGR